MRNATGLALGCMFFGIVATLTGWFVVSTVPAEAQSQGNNAVYYQSGSSGACCKGSGAFIDASVFVNTTNSDICKVLNSILTGTTYPPAGAVIDARRTQLHDCEF